LYSLPLSQQATNSSNATWDKQPLKNYPINNADYKKQDDIQQKEVKKFVLSVKLLYVCSIILITNLQSYLKLPVFKNISYSVSIAFE
jgi:hypothetical protein